MRHWTSHLLLIVAVCGVVLFTNLGSARLWDRDEPRNAGCALEMMERGNLVVPVFNDELRAQKPALLYWLMIGAYQVFGVNEFAARFWSAVLGTGTVLATYVIGRRLFNPSAALYGAIALATSMMFVVAGRAATPDSVLIFCSTVALMLYVLGTFAPRHNPADAARMRWEGYYFPQNYACVLAMYAMMGLGVLAKGPVGFIVPCAVIGMFMLIQRLHPQDNETWNQRGWLARVTVSALRPFHPRHFLETVWRMRPFTLVLVVLLVAAPWYVVVGIETGGEWPSRFLLSENFSRATSSFENHNGGLWFYPLAILLGFFPWSVFLGPMLVGVDRQITRRHHWSSAYVFCLCWIGVQVGLFSLAQTKLPSYVTPCYPALALLTGAFLAQLVSTQVSVSDAFCRLSLWTLAASGLLITAALAAVAHIFLPGDYVVAALGIIPLIGGTAALVFLYRQQPRLAVIACCALATVFATGLFGFGTVAVDRHQTSQRILDRVASADPDLPVATFACLESSWVFYGGKPIHELTDRRLEEPWTSDREFDWQRKQGPSPEQFLAANPDALIITTDRDLPRLQERLPDDYEVIERAGYFMRRNKDLVLLGRKGSAPVARVASSPDSKTVR